jgi:predicted lipid-binding transport protein (Tim44 family)
MAQPQRLRKKRHNRGPARPHRCCSFVFGTYFGHDWDYVGASGPRQGRPPAFDRTSEVIVEIVILAMIAAFLGLRLYSVLGRRAEHEEEPVPTRFERGGVGNPPRAMAPPAAELPRAQREIGGFPPAVEQGLREISAADRRFDLLTFLEGAKSAYGMVLEAFWNGDKEALRELCDDDVYASFAAAIDAREAAGEVLENRLVRIEDTAVQAASLGGRTARITVRFNADVATVTRDKDGNVIAGSLDDAVESDDIWTFARQVNASVPDWLLDETDEG